MIAGAHWIDNAVASWVRLVIRFPKTIIVVFVALTAGNVWYARGHLGINTDTADMISPELSWRRDFIAYREGFPARDRNIVIVVDADTSDAAASFAADLAAALRREPERFHSVFSAGEGEFFARNGLLYLSPAELEDLGDRLAAAQPLLGLLSDRFNGAGVASVVAATLDGREGASRDAPELDALYAEIARTLEAAAAGERRALAWRELVTGTQSASTRALVLVQPTLAFDRVRPARDAIDEIRAIAAELKTAQSADVRVRLTGTIALEDEELASVASGATWTGLSSLALVVLVLWWALRSPVEIAVSFVTLLAGLVGTTAFAALTVGHLNLLSVAFAVLYLGLGADFVLHLFLRFRELRALGREISPALVETARGVGTSLLIAAATTAVGFYAFIPTPFDGVSELGLIAGTGVLISLAYSVTLLPALVTVIPARFDAKQAAVLPPPPAWLRRPLYVIPIAAILALVSVFALPRVRFDGDPIHLRDPETESVQALRDLAADGAAPLYDLVALADDSTTAQRWAREVAELREVRRVVTIDSLVPSDQDEKQLVLEDIALVMGPNLGTLTEKEPDAVALAAALEDLRARLSVRSPLSTTEQALFEALTELRDAHAADDERRAERLRALDADLTAGLAGALRRLAAGLEAQTFARADLPSELTARYVNTRGQELVEIAPTRKRC